jgi:hypothetical protein
VSQVEILVPVAMFREALEAKPRAQVPTGAFLLLFLHESLAAGGPAVQYKW